VFVRLYGAIPVHRGQFDRKLINTAMKILASGRPLIIAPEGGRSHVPGLRHAWPGIGYLIEKSQVPVIPVGVTGSISSELKQAIRLRRPHLTMRIGRPLNLSHKAGDPKVVRAARQTNTDRIMEQIAALLPADYQGMYAVGQSDAPETNG
jgi:1-acyl-sn-glycerol-3-phosphate acyltransferase